MTAREQKKWEQHEKQISDHRRERAKYVRRFRKLSSRTIVGITPKTFGQDCWPAYCAASDLQAAGRGYVEKIRLGWRYVR